MKKIFFLTLFVLLFASCRSLNPRQPDGSWRLSHMILSNGVVLEPAGQISLIFYPEERGIGGTAVCNNYGARYTLADSVIAFSEIAATEAYCGENAGDQEFFLGLQHAQTYFRTDSSFRIKSVGDVVEMHFTPLPHNER